MFLQPISHLRELKGLFSMAEQRHLTVNELEEADRVLHIGKDYIPDIESYVRNTIYSIFHDLIPRKGNADFGDSEMLAEAIFWSIGELINNANKANNRWAILRNALFKRASAEQTDIPADKLYADIDYAIEHNQTDMLQKYNLDNFDLTTAILKLIQMHKTNSFALSERFQKRIDLTLRIKPKNEQRFLVLNVINNSPITVIDRKRVEFNLEKIKEDLMNVGHNPFEAAIRLYDKMEDNAGGGFGAGLRSIVLFLKEAYAPFSLDIVYSRLIQYRSTATSTIFSIELPVPARTAARSPS